MNKVEIIENLNAIFKEVFDDKSIIINDEMTANDVENWNSLTHMLLISKVEEVFNIKIKLKELNRLKTVGDIVTLLVEKCENT